MGEFSVKEDMNSKTARTKWGDRKEKKGEDDVRKDNSGENCGWLILSEEACHG